MRRKGEVGEEEGDKEEEVGEEEEERIEIMVKNIML